MKMTKRIDRRSLLVAAVGAISIPPGAAHAFDPTVWKKLSEAEWIQRLTPTQFAILRRSATEVAGSSDLDKERRKGIYRCAGCASPAFSSEEKFDSHTGWPSFSRPINGAIGSKPDLSFNMTRTAVFCATCEGHLGHVFKDGPPPTGMRYCVNGAALTFERA